MSAASRANPGDGPEMTRALCREFRLGSLDVRQLPRLSSMSNAKFRVHCPPTNLGSSIAEAICGYTPCSAERIASR